MASGEPIAEASLLRAQRNGPSEAAASSFPRRDVKRQWRVLYYIASRENPPRRPLSVHFLNTLWIAGQERLVETVPAIHTTLQHDSRRRCAEPAESYPCPDWMNTAV